MFAIPIVIAAPVIYGLGLGLRGLPRRARPLGSARARRRPWGRSRSGWHVACWSRPCASRRRGGSSRTRTTGPRPESLRDTLTGLGNHRAFQEEVERQWAIATRHAMPLALAIVDLDDFKQINDVRGHAAGDEVLRQAAATIATYLRRSDRAFRIGGDEFAIIMPGTDAERGQRRCGGSWRPASMGGRGTAIEVSFSAGISAIPGSRRDRDSALRPGGGGPVVGQAPRPDLRDDLRPRAPRLPIAERPPAELSALVARVAATGALRAVFQPIYDLTTGAPRGFEGLVRPLPGSGFTDPELDVPAAEATGRTAEPTSPA